MKIFPLIILFLSFGTSLLSQNLVGFRESEIRKYMQENRKDMNIADIKNSKFKYLKYSDNLDNQTILFFLKKNSVCYSERMICDYSIKNQKLEEFDRLYRRESDNRWTEVRNGKNYIITIKEGQWSFIVTIEQEK